MYTIHIYSSFIIFIMFFDYNQAIPNYTKVLIKDVDWCASPYCKIKREHTICKFGPKCPPADNCETNVYFNKEMKDYIMELHNEKRNKIALGRSNHDMRGEESKLPKDLATAANMKVLQWDIHLEFVARCHSRQCDPEHDSCRVVPRFSSVGQNVYSKTLKGKEAKHPDVQMIIDDAVEAWYNQLDNVPENIYTKWKETSESTAEFTQLIWAKTGHVGCGISQEKNDNSLKFFVVCNYGLAGNIKGKHIFVPGKPCSECLKGIKCNAQFKGLCGEIEEYSVRCPCEEENAEGSTEPITSED